MIDNHNVWFHFCVIVNFPFCCCSIDSGEGYIKINFDEMKAVTGFGSVELRRLSTKSVSSLTDHSLLTTWVWYLSDQDSSWTEYDSELMVCL